MRIFFSLRHPGTLRNFSSTVGLLAERGHAVHLAFTMQDKLGDGRILAEFSRTHPGVAIGDVADKTPWRLWLRMARATRAAVDYLRYLTPEYRQAVSLRARAEAKTPAAFRRLCGLPLVRSRVGLTLVGRFLSLVERAIPGDPATEALMARARPDVVLVSPLVDFASDQVEIVKSARALGIPVGLCVHSWDNLTNKGLIRLMPDRVYVWNEAQKREAVDMHGAPPSGVIVTGAPTYDQWFDWRPSRTREDFCRLVGLSPHEPFFVYLCSSPFIASDESAFVRKWLQALRASALPAVRRVGVLVRPHPENIQPWHRLDLSDLGNVAIWPREGSNPVDRDSKRDYFDSLYHSAGAVGVNTSALIEAGIVGRPVYTLRSSDYAATQGGTLHFRHLVEVAGGLLRVADSVDEHVAQLGAVLEGDPAAGRQASAFVQAFVRPHGLEQPATPLLADGIEALGALRVRPHRMPFWLLPLRLALLPIAWSLRTAREIERVSRKRERALRPTTTSSALSQIAFLPLELLLRWRPTKRVIKKHIVPRLAPRGGDTQWPTEEMTAVRRLAEKLARRERPLILGPWLGDPEIELLYWIPFLAWLRREYPMSPDRLVVVSRGGAAPWYRHVAARYVDVYDFFTPDQVAARQRDAESPQKLRVVTEFDRQIVKLVQQSLKTRETSLLHPMQMFRLFAPFWRHLAPVDLVERFTCVEPWAPMDGGDTTRGLPAGYVAVAPGFGPAFPDCRENRDLLRRLVEALAAESPVVLIEERAGPAGGSDLELPGVHRLPLASTPRGLLERQTQALAGARAFIGGYGGLALAAPFCGVRSAACYSRAEQLPGRHVEFAQRAVGRLPSGSLMLVPATEAVRALVGWAAGERLTAENAEGAEELTAENAEGLTAENAENAEGIDRGARRRSS